MIPQVKHETERRLDYLTGRDPLDGPAGRFCLIQAYGREVYSPSGLDRQEADVLAAVYNRAAHDWRIKPDVLACFRKKYRDKLPPEYVSNNN